MTALAGVGENERAHERAKRAVQFDPDNMRLHYNAACGMVRIDPDLAGDLIEGMIARVSPGWLRWMDIDNSLDPIREFPRFKALGARFPVS